MILRDLSAMYLGGFERATGCGSKSDVRPGPRVCDPQRQATATAVVECGDVLGRTEVLRLTEPRSANIVATPRFLDCGGKRSATPLWLEAPK